MSENKPNDQELANNKSNTLVNKETDIDMTSQYKKLANHRKTVIEGSNKAFKNNNTNNKSGRPIQDVIRECYNSGSVANNEQYRQKSSRGRPNSYSLSPSMMSRSPDFYRRRKLPQYSTLDEECTFKPEIHYNPSVHLDTDNTKKVEDRLIERYNITQKRIEERRKTQMEEKPQRNDKLELTLSGRNSSGSDLMDSYPKLMERHKKIVEQLKEEKERKETNESKPPEINDKSRELSKSKYEKDLLEAERIINNEGIIPKEGSEGALSSPLSRWDVMIAKYGNSRNELLKKSSPIKNEETNAQTPKIKYYGYNPDIRREMLYNKGIMYVRGKNGEYDALNVSREQRQKPVRKSEYRSSYVEQRRTSSHVIARTPQRLEKEYIYFSPKPGALDKKYEFV